MTPTVRLDAGEVGDDSNPRFARVIDDLAVAVDRLFVVELRDGLVDDDTLELVARTRDLAIVGRSTRAELDARGVPCSD